MQNTGPYTFTPGEVSAYYAVRVPESEARARGGVARRLSDPPREER